MADFVNNLITVYNTFKSKYKFLLAVIISLLGALLIFWLYIIVLRAIITSIYGDTISNDPNIISQLIGISSWIAFWLLFVIIAFLAQERVDHINIWLTQTMLQYFIKNPEKKSGASTKDIVDWVEKNSNYKRTWIQPSDFIETAQLQWKRKAILKKIEHWKYILSDLWQEMLSK